MDVYLNVIYCSVCPPVNYHKLTVRDRASKHCIVGLETPAGICLDTFKRVVGPSAEGGRQSFILTTRGRKRLMKRVKEQSQPR